MANVHRPWGEFAAAFLAFLASHLDAAHHGSERWQRLAARTPLLPCAALITGRWRPGLRRLSWLRHGLAVLLYASLVLLHQPVIGVSSQPIL
jgi:hypothetical protein